MAEIVKVDDDQYWVLQSAPQADTDHQSQVAFCLDDDQVSLQEALEALTEHNEPIPCPFLFAVKTGGTTQWHAAEC